MSGSDPDGVPAQRLHDLQRALTELYRLPRGEDVRGFVCDASMARRLAGEDTVSRGEALLVLEDDAGSFVGLYLDDDAVSDASTPESWLEAHANLGASCLVAEGVSHFVMVQYRAAQEIPVSELELELQAEVDKWALGALGGEVVAARSTSLLEGMGAGLVRERSRLMRRRLFSNASLRDEPESERGERYLRAIRLAHRYTARLEASVLSSRGALLTELRGFYRMVGQNKIEHAAR